MQKYEINCTWRNNSKIVVIRSFKKQVQNYEIELKKKFFWGIEVEFFLGRALILY